MSRAARGAERLHPDLPAGRMRALPFHWRWALPLWRLALRATPTSVDPSVDVRDACTANGVRVRVYRPRGAVSGAALLWLHGGGLLLGTPRMDDLRCSALARRLSLVVASVDYRLAPKHPFPAALDDAHAAWRWLLASAPGLAVEPARVAVGGASAGAGLAACLAQRVLDEGGVQPAAQLLLYPMLDDRTAARRELDAPAHLVWHNRSNRAGWSAYVGRAPGAAELPPYAAAARRTDLAGLPPAWIGVGDLDLFAEEGVAYAGRLAAAGVDVDLHVVAGAPHGFDALAPSAPVSVAFTARQMAFLRGRLGVVEPAGAP